MTDDLEHTVRIKALKKASIVMNELANSLENQLARHEAKSLAWVISWAVDELEKRKRRR